MKDILYKIKNISDKFVEKYWVGGMSNMARDVHYIHRDSSVFKKMNAKEEDFVANAINFGTNVLGVAGLVFLLSNGNRDAAIVGGFCGASLSILEGSIGHYVFNQRYSERGLKVKHPRIHALIYEL